MITRAITLLFLLVSLTTGPRIAAQPADPDEQGPGGFYYIQYEHQPWKDADSPFKLLRKSEKLLASFVVLSGWLFFKKRRASCIDSDAS